MPKRRPTHERRRQIADAAIRIIGRHGVREFTTARLARAVGITDGTIFRHFKHKQEIALAALDRLEERLDESIPHDAGDPLERLGRFFVHRVRTVASEPGIQSLMFSDDFVHAAGPLAIDRLRRLRRRGRDYMRACLVEAEASGSLRPETSVSGLLAVISGAVLGLVFLAKDQELDRPIEAAAEEVWRQIASLLRR